MPLNSTKQQVKKYAARDHAKKLVLESSLLLAIRPVFNSITNDFIKTYSVNGKIPDLTHHTNTLQDILEQHYDKTAASFSSQIENALGEPTNKAQVRNDTETAIQIHKNIEIPKAISYIHNTNIKQMHESIKKAIVIGAAAGLFLTHRQIAKNAGADLKNKYLDRLPLIATDATQNSAEHAKAAEYNSLIDNAAIAGGINFGDVADAGGAQKQWAAILDGKTRDAHFAADGQTVPYDQPYLVGGEKLRFPRDSSLGASMKNIANCRCSSVPVIS